ncbi:tetratricopeptide repeat protein [Crossiella cryophila]|uniref:Uncharacterized protein n=1 Tax=Crossiella cryophila TaxID=43355 RepID=A0A7W7CCJ0_9PSEU|nr:tetratricopeptide repeat protein [Crossiella cryophila]MBB4678670.1 hypothetical protein [Crossiella cryophila]
MRRWLSALTCLTAALAVTLPAAPATASTVDRQAAPPVAKAVPGSQVALAKQHDDLTTAAYVDDGGALTVSWATYTNPWHPAVRISGPLAKPGSPVALAKQAPKRLTAAFMDTTGRLMVAWVDDTASWHPPVAISGPVGVPGGHVALVPWLVPGLSPVEIGLTAAFLDKDGKLRSTTVFQTEDWPEPTLIDGREGNPGQEIVGTIQDVDGSFRQVFGWTVPNGLVAGHRDGKTGQWRLPNLVASEPESGSTSGGVAMTRIAPGTVGAAMVYGAGTGGQVRVTAGVDDRPWLWPARIGMGGLSLPREAKIAQAMHDDETITAAVLGSAGTFNVATAQVGRAWGDLRAVSGPVGPAGAPIAMTKQTDEQLTAAFIGEDGQLTLLWADENHSWHGPGKVPSADAEVNRLLDDARARWVRGERDQAIATTRQAITLARLITGYDQRYAVTLGDALADPLATYLAETGNRDEAIATLREAAEIFTRAGDRARADAAKQRLAGFGVFTGRWILQQSNGYTVHLDAGLADTAGGFTATASFDGVNGTIVGGKVSATGTSFEIHWADGVVGRYTGQRGADGRWTGETVRLTGEPITARWTATVATP